MEDEIQVIQTQSSFSYRSPVDYAKPNRERKKPTKTLNRLELT